MKFLEGLPNVEAIAEVVVLIYFAGIGLGILAVGAVRGWEKFRSRGRERQDRRRRR